MPDDGDNLIEDWDHDFLEEVIRVSELATSSSSASNLTQTAWGLNPYPQPPTVRGGGGGGEGISYSPPRELSQKVPDGDGAIKGFHPPFLGFIDNPAPPNVDRNVKLKKVPDADAIKGFDPPFLELNCNPIPSNGDRNMTLKRDASRVLKQLNPQEQGGQHVRKADKKKEPPKPTFSLTEFKDTDIQHKYSQNLEHQTRTQDLLRLTSRVQNGSSVNDLVTSRTTVVTPTCKSIGIQTDELEGTAPVPFSVKNDNFTCQNRRNKLLAIWELPTRQPSKRNLASDLLAACETDLGILFGSVNFVSREAMISPVDQTPSAQSSEAEKVSNLYSILTKIGSGMVKLDSLLEALVDLCRLDNEVVLYRSLRVLHKALTHTSCLDARSNKRDNVIVERPSSGNTAESSSFRLDELSHSIFTAFRAGLTDAENIHKMEPRTCGYAPSISCLDWISVFELMSRIAVRNAEEGTRLEAVSIMNMILIRSDAYVDRERFGRVLGFQTISQFLRKDSGSGVQKEAVHLLYLLLNCPQLMAMFCSGCKEELESVGDVDSGSRNGSAVQEFGPILAGLADCVACGGNGALELKLRRKTVILLAFLASSGKHGFEILLAQKLLKRSNYLALILQMLVLEMDAEVSDISEPSEVFKERTLLIRETLIFLNRLVSNPQFSTPVLRVLTENKATACLAVDVANRLSKKTKPRWQSDNMTRQMRESEIVELAQVFRNRVFTHIEKGSL